MGRDLRDRDLALGVGARRCTERAEPQRGPLALALVDGDAGARAQRKGSASMPPFSGGSARMRSSFR